ncbi:hypothetical protein [Pontibacter ruber]|uniref:Uncharacterized protein n=1 Tax=Pontibacter ruber TaxID=1343895 RepID=A0ABW5CV56_9BACT|nr:hypothetical protein [Pontibacter ruber]
MRRHRRPSTGAISDTWNYSQRSADESLEFTHQFTDTVNEPLMEEDRIEHEKQLHHPVEPTNEPAERTDMVPPEEGNTEV